MSRTNGRGSLALALAVGALAAVASAEPTSPSEVLRRADEKLGAQYVNLAPVAEGADRTLAPYFHVVGGADTERLPLKQTSADVSIAGVIARVQVRQVFENSGRTPIEAQYVFPASTRAAVHGMRMTIGERTIEAKIEKKEKARQDYEQARSEGRRASLLEQQRPNVFTMSVANILPGDRIEVRLDYSELLVPESSIYEFVYPAVVGPRYAGGADPKSDTWMANPYLKEGEKEPYRFEIRAHLETGIALKEVASPSHRIAVSYLSSRSADVALGEQGGGNRDFVLRYRLAGDNVESGLLLYRGATENFFLLQVEPPQRPAADLLPPREYVFLLDVSGSMMGFPLDTAKRLMDGLLRQLRPTDRFNVAMFSGSSYVMHREGSVPATEQNVRQALQLVGRQSGGGTELLGGLRSAYGIPRAPGFSRTVVVVTDGYVGVEAAAFKFVRERLQEANLFAFGIGSSVNRALIECLARAGLGEPFVVLKPEAAAGMAERFSSYIAEPVLTGVEVRYPGFDAREVAPSKVPDVLARRPLAIFGKFRGEPAGRIELSGTTGRGVWRESVDVSAASARDENAPLRWLWARRWVSLLEDEHMLGAAPEIEEAITDLGLSYTLLTRFTSFVAIDSQKANKTGQSTTVQQPLPLPEGVANSAVGGAMMLAKSKSSGGAAYGAGGYAGMGGMGTRGSGSGGGGRAMGMMRMAALAPAAPVAAPPPAPPPAPAPARAAARPDDARSATAELDAPSHAGGERPAEAKPPASARKDSAPPTARILDAKADGLAGTDPLVKALLEALRTLQTSCLAEGTRMRLRLHVDGAGRVAKVEFLQGDRSRLWCVPARLGGMATEARPAGAGTLELTVVVAR